MCSGGGANTTTAARIMAAEQLAIRSLARSLATVVARRRRQAQRGQPTLLAGQAARARKQCSNKRTHLNKWAMGARD